jgi:hypothetical protein
MITILMVLCHEASGKDKVLRLSVTSVEPHEDRPSRVDAQTVGYKPTLHYKLACGLGAENIEVGHVYKAAETEIEQTKTLVISDVRTANGGRWCCSLRHRIREGSLRFELGKA